jgi:hypothetical protein
MSVCPGFPPVFPGCDPRHYWQGSAARRAAPVTAGDEPSLFGGGLTLARPWLVELA